MSSLLIISIMNLYLKALILRNNLPRIKDGAYVITPDDKKVKENIWVSLSIDKNTVVYYDSFGIEYNPAEILNKIRDKLITHKIFTIQDGESIMCRFYCILLENICLQEKTLIIICFLQMTIKRMTK